MSTNTHAEPHKQKVSNYTPRMTGMDSGGSGRKTVRSAGIWQRLKTMLRQLRKELDAPDLIVVLTVNPHFERGKNPYVETIIEHQKLLARTDPRVAYVDATPAGTADRFHFDSAGIHVDR